MRIGTIKWFVAAGVLAAGLQAYRARSNLALWIERHRFQLHGIDQALPCEVYLLHERRCLEFDLPLGEPLIRLISNATIPRHRAGSSQTEWTYAIQYELSGDAGTNLSGTYHFKAEQLAYLDKQTRQPAEVNFFLDRDLTPLSGLHWFINPRDPTCAKPKRLRLRLHSKHPDLSHITVRVYFQARVPERKAGYLWNRLSDDQKRDLARGNVYGFEGITEQEKQFLLSSHWEVAAPKGVPGHDYTRRLMFVREDFENLTLIKPWVPAGIFIDADHHAALPLTNQCGSSVIELRDAGPTSSVQVVSTTLLWHKDAQQGIETNSFAWCGQTHSIVTTNGGGLLELHSPRPAYLRTFQVQEGATNETTAVPPRLVVFTCSPSNSVEFTFEGNGTEPTLFRVDIRRMPPTSTKNTDPVLPRPDSGLNSGAGEASKQLSHTFIEFALLNSSNAVLKQDRLVLTNGISAFDWVVNSNSLESVSVPQSAYYLLPKTVAKVRISSPQETILANAYTRPYGLIKSSHVPEDYEAVRAFAPEQPSWFTLRPPDYAQRHLTKLDALVQLQAHLPEYDPLIVAGEYSWDSFVPETDLRGHMILLPFNPAEKVRAESAAFTYHPVPIGCEAKVRFCGEPFEPQVNATLLLISTNSGRGPVSILLDGQTLFSNRLETAVTEFHLGNVLVGTHQLSIQGENISQAALNYLESQTSPLFLQRFCLQSHSTSINIPYQKRSIGSELLVARFFSPLANGIAKPFAVSLKLTRTERRSIGPFADLTFGERRAEVTPGLKPGAWLVSATEPLLDEGLPVFFPVGSDIPPGNYTITLEIQSNSPRWFCLSRTTPGTLETFTIHARAL